MFCFSLLKTITRDGNTHIHLHSTVYSIHRVTLIGLLDIRMEYAAHAYAEAEAHVEKPNQSFIKLLAVINHYDKMFC